MTGAALAVFSRSCGVLVYKALIEPMRVQQRTLSVSK
jgi:hypothetical protein